MEPENPEGALEAKGMWHDPNRVLSMWEFKGSAEHPDRTAEEAEKHVRQYMQSGDNEFITDSELIDIGFVKKELVE